MTSILFFVYSQKKQNAFRTSNLVCIMTLILCLIVTNSRQYLDYTIKVAYQVGRCINVTDPRILLKKKYNSNSLIEKTSHNRILIISPLNCNRSKAGDIPEVPTLVNFKSQSELFIHT